MTDQSLREALEALAADWRSQPADPDSTGMTVMRHCGAQIARALDEHPAEPPIGCPCLQDESGIEVKPGCPEHDPRPAAVQVEVPQVAVIRGYEVLRERWGVALPILHSDVHALLCAIFPLLGPRPLLDREKVKDAVFFNVEKISIRDSGEAADAVMKLARPMPTREQIEKAVADAGIGSYRAIVTNALLALLNGTES